MKTSLVLSRPELKFHPAENRFVIWYPVGYKVEKEPVSVTKCYRDRCHKKCFRSSSRSCSLNVWEGFKLVRRWRKFYETKRRRPVSERKGNIVSTSRELQQLFISIEQGKQALLDFVVSRAWLRYPVPGSKIVVKSRSVKSVKRNAKNARGLGRDRAVFLAATAPFPKSRASYFRSARFNTSPLYYLRAWHRLDQGSKSNNQFLTNGSCYT